MRRGREGLLLLGLGCLFALLAACGTAPSAQEKASPAAWEDLIYDRSLDLQYAQNFSVDYYQGGYALISITDGGRYLVVPPDRTPPQGIEAGITVLQQPLDNVYLAASSAMDLLCGLDGLDAVRFAGIPAEDWYVSAAREAMEAGELLYAGKYNAPDYEALLAQGCDLAVESTMIYHTPEVKEKLEEFGIPVLVERSSYEPHPLGRTEWIKLYGVLLGKEELAETLVEEQTARMSAAAGEATGQTAAFFYINNTGAVNVRKSADYVSKMIELAGGTYVFQDLGEEETALSTVNLQMETFYAAAQEADVLIYNSTIDGGVATLDDLFAKSPLLRKFKAVRAGNVWCTTKNMFQETLHLGDMVAEFHAIFAGTASDTMTYLYRLS